MICTFIFVMSCLIVKDSESSKYVATIGENGVGWFGCAIIASALTAMIITAGPHSGAALNPAVSISQQLLANGILNLSGYTLSFWRIYMMGPILGGLLAGFFSVLHSNALSNWAGEMTEAEKAADEPEVE